MDPSQLLLTAFVKFPSFRGCDVWISPYIRGLLKRHWSAVESGNLNIDSTNLMVDMCQHIVNLTSSFILKAIKPVISDWHRKSLRLQQYLYPRHCFFGVDGSDVLANLKNILPQCVCNGLSLPTSVHCESLDKFIQLVAREVTRGINSQIAVVMDLFNWSLQPKTFDCNCICYTTLHTMIALVTQMLRCMYQQSCQCTPLSTDLERPNTTPAIRDNGKKRPLRSWCEDSDDWVSTDSTDVSERSGNHADISTYDDDSELTTDTEQRSYQTDTQDSDDDQSEDSLSQESAETINSGPVCQKTATSQPTPAESSVSPASLHEDQVDGSTDAIAVSSDTGSLQPVTYDDTKHQLLILVLVELLLRTTKRARTSLPQTVFNRVIRNLRDKALGKIHANEIAVSSNPQSVEKIYKAVLKDLCQHFGSAEVLLQAMTSQDPTTDDFVTTTLRDHLIVPSPNNKKKKSAIVRFFSCLGGAIVKPFRACMSNSSPPEGDKQNDGNTSLMLAKNLQPALNA
ncbi:uncharacterized protein LOC121910056 isoform X1 [Thunnus maccoyii]|uniref:uncharacterized protein LOC121910056 isoform X1 n=1 Tax=Thunnus maccoyii TaxID=8240 RepID=UPI001C4B4C64|nr:uncharacterized protein LOC121910056 isoform X1 [Thunnus maccoyii]